MTTEARKAVLSFIADLVCIAAFVIIGTRNHNTDTDASSSLTVAAPFLLALFIAYLTYAVSRRPWTITSGVYVWIITVTVGMIERSFLFDKGTAPTFVFVTAAFLFATMIGWRGAANKIAERNSATR